jgi:hypothetical protein
MAAKKESAKKEAPAVQQAADDDQTREPNILTSKQEVADALKMTVYQFSQLLRRYSFATGAGVSGKLNGRWHVPKDYVFRWYRYVQRQELRHPDARRMRPDEPPELRNIQGR